MSKTLVYKIIIIALLIALSATLIIFTVDFNSENKGVVVDNNGNELSKTEVNEMPSGMKFVPVADVYTETSIRVTATVKPDNASNKNLNFSIVWVNAGSEWATGKNLSDYLTVSSSANVATITCKQAFGEQAKLVAVSQVNESARAECTIDYVARLESCTVEIYGTVGDQTTKLGVANSVESLHDTEHKNPAVLISDLNKYETDYKFVPKFKFGLGTINNEELITAQGGYLTLSNSFKNAYRQLGGVVSDYVGATELIGALDTGYGTNNKADLVTVLINHSISNNEEFALLNQIVSSGNCVFNFYLVNVTVGNVHLASVLEFCFGVSKDYNYIAVSGIEFNKNNVSF